MEDNAKLIESLFEKATDYGKTSFELIKLKTLDKTTDVVSSLIPHSIVFVLISSFMLFLNIGLSFWLGEILGKTFYGFLVVAAFYLVVSVVVHFFMHKTIKRGVSNYIIQRVLNK